MLKWLKKGEMLSQKAGATPISTCLTQILAVRVLIANDAYYWCFTVLYVSRREANNKNLFLLIHY